MKTTIKVALAAILFTAAGPARAGLSSPNGLNSINGLSSPNGLNSINGLSSPNGLNAVNGLSAPNGLNSINGLCTVNGLSVINGLRAVNRAVPQLWGASGINPSQSLTTGLSGAGK